MLGIGKRKKKEKNQQEQLDPKLAEQIHTMPERFYVQSSGGKRSGLTIMIVVGIFVIAGLATGAFYLSQNLNKSAPVPPAPVESAEVSEPEPEVEVEPEVDIDPEPEVEVEPETSTTTDPIEDPEPEVEQQDLSVDLDRDDLTYIEEQMYGTDPEDNDSDDDGFRDGQELFNGYDPSIGGSTVKASGLFKEYSNNMYSVSYPEVWTLRQQDTEGTEVLFISSTGEFVEVLVLDNIEQLNLNDWLASQFPEYSNITPIRVTINNLSGILGPNGRTYYLISNTDASKIFVATYNVGSFNDLKYLTTFRAIANSLESVN